ncbi:MAG: RNA 3'-terminal phosphate cyclase [Anaerolineae bacterium]
MGASEAELIRIDGAQGEGGGQILRTALTLSALTGKEFLIENIRAGRKRPGLAAQHLTSVLAVAGVCQARLEGAALGSVNLRFRPQSRPRPGDYRWDVGKARKGGSAGATTLVLQAVVPVLAKARGSSTIQLVGGTHVAWSPPFHHTARVYLPTLKRTGLVATVELVRWGWYPVGRGEIRMEIAGGAELQGLDLTERADLVELRVLSAVSNLPRAVARRQAERARARLTEAGFDVETEVVEASGMGQGSFVQVLALYAQSAAGFGALGRKGKSAEQVGEEAAEDFLSFHRSGATVDQHLADQLVVPLAMASGPSHLTTERITRHLLTNTGVAQKFLERRLVIEGEEGRPGRLSILSDTSEEGGAGV